MERQQRQTVGRRPLRKNAHHATALQTRGHFVHGPLGVPALLPMDENRIEPMSQPAHDRPLPHFRLRHERRGPPRVDHVDIGPRNMVTDYERPVIEPILVMVNHEPHARQTQELQRPRAVDLAFSRIGTA